MKSVFAVVVTALATAAGMFFFQTERRTACVETVAAAERLEELTQTSYDHIDKILLYTDESLNAAAAFDVGAVARGAEDIAQETERMTGLGDKMKKARADFKKHSQECTAKGF